MSKTLNSVGINKATIWSGVYSAVVYNNTDPLGLGRVQLQIPQIMGMAISAWAEPVGMDTNAVVPAVGSYVLAMFIGGSIHKPVYMPESWTVQETPDWINVTLAPYSADKTGATDAAPAIQAALNAISTGGVIYIPTGSYKIGTSLNVANNNTTIIGDGWGTQLRFDGTSVSPCIGQADTTNRYVVLQDLRITQTSGTSAGTAVEATYWHDSKISRLLIDGSTNNPNIGISMNAATTYYNVVEDCRINCDGTNGMCIRIDNVANSNVIRNCRLLPSGSDTSQIGIYVNANTTLLDRVDVEHAAGTGISLGASAHATVILAPYLESNGYNVVYASGVSNPFILGGSLLTPVTANIQDNGAIAPCTLVARSGTATPFTKAIFQQPSSLGQIVRVINRTASPTDSALRVETLNAGEHAIGVQQTGDTSNRLRIDSDGTMSWGTGSGTFDVVMNRQAANILQLTSADLDIATTGNGLRVAEGTNARMGHNNLVAGTVTTTNTSVTANTRIFYSVQTPGGTQGFISVTRVPGTSITFTSTSNTETSTVAWLLVEPG